MRSTAGLIWFGNLHNTLGPNTSTPSPRNVHSRIPDPTRGAAASHPPRRRNLAPPPPGSSRISAVGATGPSSKWPRPASAPPRAWPPPRAARLPHDPPPQPPAPPLAAPRASPGCRWSSGAALDCRCCRCTARWRPRGSRRGSARPPGPAALSLRAHDFGSS